MPQRDHEDILIVGTGVHGMHLYIRLCTLDSFSGARICTIDPAPQPLALWKKRAANTTMKYLRSPASHGLHPSLPRIRRFAGAGDFIPPYHRPSLALFNQHSETEIAACRLQRNHYTGVIEDIQQKRAKTVVSLRRNDDSVLHVNTDVVVLAPGQPPLNIPEPFQLPSRRITHIYSNCLLPERLSGAKSVAIVGCGIGGTHLAVTLSSQGIRTEMWCRNVPETWQFDSDPCFIGPRCGDVFRRVTAYNVRRNIIRKERRTGSVPPDLARRRDQMLTGEHLAILHTDVLSVQETEKGIQLKGNASGTTRCYDHVVLATGFVSEPPANKLIERVSERYNLPRAEDGFPLVDASLRWRPTKRTAHANTTVTAPRIYCMGALAELELGPPARNIIGAHLAGRRITADLLRSVSR